MINGLLISKPINKKKPEINMIYKIYAKYSQLPLLVPGINKMKVIAEFLERESTIDYFIFSLAFEDR